MRRLVRVGACVLAVLVVGSAARAAELEKGAWELGISALIQDTDNAGFYLNISTRLGYLITANHEAGPVVAVLYSKPDDGGSITAASLGGFYRYNFGTTNKIVVPFLGFAAAGYLGDLSHSLRWSWQAESGLRIMPSPRVSINNVLFWHRDYTKAWWVTSKRYFGLAVGVSLFL
jgi:hypothetical protein